MQGSVISQCKHCQNVALLCGELPHSDSFGAVLPGAPALINAVRQQRQPAEIALSGCIVIVLCCVCPVLFSGSFPAGFQLVIPRLVRVMLCVQQTVEQRAVQRGRVAPRVQHHAVDALGGQRQLHGILQGIIRHGPGRGAAVGAGGGAGSEQRQPCAAFVVAQGPQLQPLRLSGRHRVLRPRCRNVMNGQRRLQRYQNMGLHFQRIVQCAHQGPETFLVLPLVKVFHRLLIGRAAGTRRAVGRCLQAALCTAHRAEADASVCSSCHRAHHSSICCHALV